MFVSEIETWERLDIDLATAVFPVRALYRGTPMWVFRIGERFRGVQDTCPHVERSLGTARIVGEGKMLRCTFHNYTFKLENGAGVNCPGYRIVVYDVYEHDGILFAQEKAL
jgi:nitrite reductase/ring-hydroxylating ferredoxin subunit